MRVPQYKRSAAVRQWQRRLLTVFAVGVGGLLAAVALGPVAQQAYWRAQRHSSSPRQQLRAINRLLPAAVDQPAEAAALLDHLLILAADPDLAAPVRSMVAWVAEREPLRAALDQRVAALSDPAFVVVADGLAGAGQWSIPSRLPEHHARRARLGLAAASTPAALCAALDYCRRVTASPELRFLVEPLVAHEDPDVRQAALRTVAVLWGAASRPTLTRALDDGDPGVRATAADFLDAIRCPAVTAEPVIAALPQDADDCSNPAALYAILKQDDPAAWLPALRRVVDDGLRHANGAVAGAALDVLARLDDRAMLPVMLEVAVLEVEQPLLNWMAARAAARLDPVAGARALCRLFAQPHDIVRDLAAVDLARIGTAQVHVELEIELFAVDRAARGTAALALALDPNRPALFRGRTLEDILRTRVDLTVGNTAAERHWLPRGYAWCALAVLGEPGARDALDQFLVNEHFPRTAIWAALLAAGDPAPIDILLDSAAYDDARAHEVLRDGRFDVVLEQLVPGSPRIPWSAAPAERQAALRRLKAWWQVQRSRLVWDAEQLRWTCGE